MSEHIYNKRTQKRNTTNDIAVKRIGASGTTASAYERIIPQNNKHIEYYSSAVGYPTPLSSTPVPATPLPLQLPSATLSSQPGLSLMQIENGGESGNQSVDLDRNGTGSSESSSSLGDSATAAARVLAAWQDRTTTTAPGSAQLDSEGGGGWGSYSNDMTQSSSSTPRHTQIHSVFNNRNREGSAPVQASASQLDVRQRVQQLQSDQRRSDAGFLALLNSAAAFVAESSTNNNAPQSDNEGTYLHNDELLSAGSSLALPGISNDFSQVVDDERSTEFEPRYTDSLSTTAYQDIAQALQHIAATTAGPGTVVPTGLVNQQPQGSLNSQQGYDANDTATAAAAAVAAITVTSAMPPGYTLSSEPLSTSSSADMQNSSAQWGPSRDGTGMGIAHARTNNGSTSKRKRRNEAGGANQTHVKRKSSRVSADHSKQGTPSEIRRAARKWTEEETENLLRGCSKYGVGAWKKILDDPMFLFNNRTSVDLKDRFRTIRAQECAHTVGSKSGKKNTGKEPDVVWPLPPNSQRLQGLQRVQRKPTRNYTRDEDRRLLLGVLKHANHWTKIAADPELQLDDRPGQSLRDRLRNAFPSVFELFGYVIPKKERADRERHESPTPQDTTPHQTPSKRKAPTGSKRLEGEIPQHIKGKILEVLSSMKASLDPHPISEDNDDSSGGLDNKHSHDMEVDHDNSIANSDMHDSDIVMKYNASPDVYENRGIGINATPSKFDSKTGSQKNKRAGKGSNKKGLTTQKKASSRRQNARSKPRKENNAESQLTSSASFSLPLSSDGLNLMRGTQNAFSRRSGSISANQLVSKSYLDALGPSMFSQPVSGGQTTPTDQIDALALEGHLESGYSTPTHSTKRRHSVQSADLRDAMAAAAAVAVGMGRQNFPPTLQLFGTSDGVGLNGASSAPGAPIEPMSTNSMSSISQGIVEGSSSIPADAFLFPRLPEEEGSAQHHMNLSTNRSNGDDIALKSRNDRSVAALTMSPTIAASNNADEYNNFKVNVPDSAPLSRRGEQISNIQQPRMGRSNTTSVATPPNGNANRVDLSSLTQFSQWFPNFSSSLGWEIGDAATSNGGIDPNMLNANNIPSTISASAQPGSGDVGIGSGSFVGTTATNESSSIVHARRRSQYDWYGITPSLAAALDVASNNSQDGGQNQQVNNFSLATGASGTPSYRRPSMPIFPTFAYPTNSDILGVSGQLPDPSSGDRTVFGTNGQDNTNMAAAAAAAAAVAVAAALTDNTEGIEPSADPSLLTNAPIRSTVSASSATDIQRGDSLSLGNQQTRVAPRHGRRRTMHVPPSLFEGVAAEFGEFSDDMSLLGMTGSTSANVTPAIPIANIIATNNGNGSMYPPRPEHTEVSSMRIRRSLTISNGQQDANTQRTGVSESASPIRNTASGSFQLSVNSSSLSTQLQQQQFTSLPTHLIITSQQSTTSASATMGRARVRAPSAADILTASPNNVDYSSTASGGGVLKSNGEVPLFSRHSRSYSGTQFPQDAINGLMAAAVAGVSPDSMMLGDSNQTLESAGISREGVSSTSSSAGLSGMPPAATSITEQTDRFMEPIMAVPDATPATTLGISSDGNNGTDGNGGMDLSSYKQALWTMSAFANDTASGRVSDSMVDETRSMGDMYNRDMGIIDLYRPASSTPADRANTAVRGDGSGSARNCSPQLVSQSAPVVSPVTPRSAASTPGRREAIGI